MYCPSFRVSSVPFVASYGCVTRATSGFACVVTETSEARLEREGEGEGGTADPREGREEEGEEGRLSSSTT